jgi:hypothetical protein
VRDRCGRPWPRGSSPRRGSSPVSGPAAYGAVFKACEKQARELGEGCWSTARQAREVLPQGCKWRGVGDEVRWRDVLLVLIVVIVVRPLHLRCSWKECYLIRISG